MIFELLAAADEGDDGVAFGEQLGGGRTAAAAPMPVPAPVTSATFPENSVLLFMALPTSRQ